MLGLVCPGGGVDLVREIGMVLRIVYGVGRAIPASGWRRSKTAALLRMAEVPVGSATPQQGPPRCSASLWSDIRRPPNCPLVPVTITHATKENAISVQSGTLSAV